MKGGDKSSRAQILKKASEYIQYKRRKNSSNQSDMDDLKRQNDHLEAQIRALERAKNVGTFGKSVTELLNDEGLLAEGESLPTSNDLEPSVSGARAVAPGQSLLKKFGFPKEDNQSILGFPTEENHSMLLLESHLDF